jgi:hypothetical protein
LCRDMAGSDDGSVARKDNGGRASLSTYVPIKRSRPVGCKPDAIS